MNVVDSSGCLEYFSDGPNASCFVPPIPTIYFTKITAVLQFVARYTRFGRYVYATGGNLYSARLVGINVDMNGGKGNFFRTFCGVYDN